MQLREDIIRPPYNIAIEFKEIIQKELFFNSMDCKLSKEDISKQWKKLKKRRDELSEKYDFCYEPFYDKEKVGLKDYTGEIVIPARYDDFSLIYAPDDNEFPTESIVAIKNNKCGVVSIINGGKELTAFEFDNWKWTPDTYFVEKEGKAGIISEEDGHYVLPCEFDDIDDKSIFSIWILRKEGKYAFVDFIARNEYLVTEPIYSSFRKEGNLLCVSFDGKDGYIDKEGKFTLDSSKAYLHYHSF